MKDAFTIERARPEDAAALLEYLKIIGGETENLTFGAEGLSVSVEDETALLAAQLDSHDDVYLVARADGQIVGDASLNRMPRRMSHRGELGIGVRQAWWGCGVGSALMAGLVDFAAANGFAQLELQVRSDNTRAIALYEKFGFRHLCTHPAFFRVDGADVDFQLMLLRLPGETAQR